MPGRPSGAIADALRARIGPIATHVAVETYVIAPSDTLRWNTGCAN
jgi:hypothetical protein